MASLNVPSFSNGQIADATAVTSNFNNVKTFVENQVVQIDGSVKAPTVAIVDGAITSDKLATNAVTAVKILNGVVSNSKLDYTTVPQITVSNSGPTGGKDGDIWVQVV